MFDKIGVHSSRSFLQCRISHPLQIFNRSRDWDGHVTGLGQRSILLGFGHRLIALLEEGSTFEPVMFSWQKQRETFIFKFDPLLDDLYPTHVLMAFGGKQQHFILEPSPKFTVQISFFSV